MTDSITKQPHADADDEPAAEPTAEPASDLVAGLRRVGETLARGILSLFYILMFEVMNYVIFGLAAVQYLTVIFTGRPIAALHPLNERLAAYVGDISGYLTCIDSYPPFPFSRPRKSRAVAFEPGWRRRKDNQPPRIG